MEIFSPIEAEKSSAFFIVPCKFDHFLEAEKSYMAIFMLVTYYANFALEVCVSILSVLMITVVHKERRGSQHLLC